MDRAGRSPGADRRRPDPSSDEVWEKPPDFQAKACLDAGCLWNTFVLVAKSSTLIHAGRKVLPHLSARMVRAALHSAGGSVWATEREYGLAAKTDFSRTILQECPELFAVSPLPSVTWSDLGAPRMVMQALQMTVPWALAARS